MLKKKFRLLKNNDFQNIIYKNKKIISPYFFLFYQKNEINHFRFGVSVNRKIKKIVLRNKIKRQIKNMFVKLTLCKQVSYDLLIMVKLTYNVNEFEKNYRELQDLFNRWKRVIDYR